MIQAIIIEDSRLARLELKELLQKHPEINIIGEAATAVQGLELIKHTSPDLIFLDIHLPGASGFDILQQLDHLPAIIFTTAFEQYALKSYEFPAIDYLLKPIVPEHLARALYRAQVTLNHKPDKNEIRPVRDRIFIKDQQKSWLIALDEVYYFESKGNYVQVCFAGNRPLMLRSLQQLERSLNPAQFMRVNRQQIVNRKYILQIEQNFVNRLKLILPENISVNVSRRQVSRFRGWFAI